MRSLFWLLKSSSKLSLENKILIYKVIIKPIWTYGIQLWGSAIPSNIAIIQRFQSKTLRLIANAPLYISNNRIHSDLNILHVNTEVCNASAKYVNRLGSQQNPLAREIVSTNPEVRRLQRCHPLDLPSRFN